MGIAAGRRYPAAGEVASDTLGRVLGGLVTRGDLTCATFARIIARNMTQNVHFPTRATWYRIAAALDDVNPVFQRMRRALPIRAKRRGASRKAIPAARRRAVMKADSGRCIYCGAGGKLEIDHVLPVSRGGDDSQDNLVAACKTCNRAKRARTPLEWKLWAERNR